jgi:hypothetical protein
MQSALQPVWLYIIFSHDLTSGTIFVKNLLSVKHGFDVLYNFCPKHFLILRRIPRAIINEIGVHVEHLLEFM